MIRNFPDHARTVGVAAGGEEFIGWGRDRFMMADLIDRVAETTYATVMGNVDKKDKNKIPDPEPYERPQTANQKRETKRSKGGGLFAAMAKAQLRQVENAKKVEV